MKPVMPWGFIVFFLLLGLDSLWKACESKSWRDYTAAASLFGFAVVSITGPSIAVVILLGIFALTHVHIYRKRKLRKQTKEDIEASFSEQDKREIAGKIVLQRVADEFDAAKALSQIYDLGLREVTELVQSLPKTLQTRATKAEADYVKTKLGAVNAEVVIR